MTLKRLALAAILAGVALVPATTASAAHHPVKIRLGLVPLQTAQLGAAGASFALSYDSGSIPNDEAGLDFFGVHIVAESGSASIGGGGKTHFHTARRVNGYALDYGDPFTGSTGVMEIRSGVEEYKTPADARRGLHNSVLEYSDISDFSSSLLPITVKRAKPIAVGQRRFARLITLSAANLNPIVELAEYVTAGRFVLELTVTAGSESAAEHAAPHLLRVLHHRLFLMLTGRASGKAPHAPSVPQPGQAPGGPDLSTMILQPSDVGQSHAVNLFQGYGSEPPALSAFIMELRPAGTYDLLAQEIGWWPTATEATYASAYEFALSLGLFAALDATVTPVDLSTLDDPATGYLIDGAFGGGSAVYITLTNGQAGEAVVATSSSTLQVSDVQSLAQAAANRLDAGLGP